MRGPRGHFLLLALAALFAWAVGGSDVVLYLAPFLLVAGLLLSGRYVGEEILLVRRRSRGVPKLGAALARGRSSLREQPLASLLERTPRSLRGPPALVA
jgi:hypothetical protein